MLDYPVTLAPNRGLLTPMRRSTAKAHTSRVPAPLSAQPKADAMDRHALIIPARGPASAATHHHTGGPQAKAGSRPYLFGTRDGKLG
jgi:hypothetical protein